MDRGEDSGGEHGHRTRRVAGACTERRAERQRRGGARAGCRVAARAQVGAAQRRACWVPRSGARAGCRAAALGGGQATAGASTKVPCVFLRNWSLLRRKTNAQEAYRKTMSPAPGRRPPNYNTNTYNTQYQAFRAVLCNPAVATATGAHSRPPGVVRAPGARGGRPVSRRAAAAGPGAGTG